MSPQCTAAMPDIARNWSKAAFSSACVSLLGLSGTGIDERIGSIGSFNSMRRSAS